MNQTIAIHERFHAFQGEGVHMGRAAYFIRTFGCPVHCPWCDSAGTWHKDYVPKDVEKADIANLATAAAATSPAFAVITGGEPTVQPNLSSLIDALHDVGLLVHLETCGAYEFNTDSLDWITLSPKREALPLAVNVLSAHELKIIVDHPEAINEWIATLNSIVGSNLWRHRQVWLHPEWSRRDDPRVLDAISEAVKTHQFRAGWQLHKLYQVDRLDPLSRPTVPLGGNPALGH